MLSDAEVGTGTTELEALLEGDGGYREACRQLLHLLRRQLGMDLAWTSEFVGNEQVCRMVDSEPGLAGPEVGVGTPLNQTYCARVLAGEVPPVIPDARAEPRVALLDATWSMHIGAYLGVPLHDVDGETNGMLCVSSSDAAPSLDESALTTARLVAQVLDQLHHHALDEGAAHRERGLLRDQVRAAIKGEGWRSVLQPIVELHTGDAVAAEGLTRFRDGRRSPSAWFAAAHSIGLGPDLELAAARGALARLHGEGAPPALSLNLSPEVVVSDAVALLADVDLSRVILELTEHVPVSDYDRLAAVLEPLRREGLRIAVDDAGAGYASLSHVLRLRPDLIKVDISLVRDVDTDPVRQALIAALVRFSGAAGASVVAEGIETMGELDAVIGLGVPYAQGFLFGRPSERPQWAGHPVGSGPGTGPAL